MFGENVRDAGEGFGRFGLDLFGVLGAVEDLGDGVADDVAGTSDVGAVVDVHDAFGYLEIPTMLLSVEAEQAWAWDRRPGPNFRL